MRPHRCIVSLSGQKATVSTCLSTETLQSLQATASPDLAQLALAQNTSIMQQHLHLQKAWPRLLQKKRS